MVCLSKAETTFSPVIFSNFRKPSFHSCLQYLLTCQNHSKQCNFCITYTAGHRTPIILYECLSLFQTLWEPVWEKLYLETVHQLDLPKGLADFLLVLWILGSYLDVTPLQQKNYIVNIVNMMFLSGAWTKDGFFLELSYSEYEVWVLRT